MLILHLEPTLTSPFSAGYDENSVAPLCVVYGSEIPIIRNDAGVSRNSRAIQRPGKMKEMPISKSYDAARVSQNEDKRAEKCTCLL